MFAPKEAEAKSGAGRALSKLSKAGPEHDSETEQPETRVREREANLSWNFSRISIFPAAPADQSPPAPPKRPKSLQRKPIVGSVSDPLEREADAVADRVMHASDAISVPSSQTDQPQTNQSQTDQKLQRKCGAACRCEACRAGQDNDEPTLLARKESVPGADFDLTAAPEIVDDVLRSPGEQIGPADRKFFESRFRRDFRDVRIHAGTRAGESARSVGALAYTVGRNIVFGRGQYKPGTSTGRRLLAHELAHVEQQRNGRPASGERIFRQASPEDEEEERRKRAAEEEERKKQEPQADAGAESGSATPSDAGTAEGIATPDAGAGTSATPEAPAPTPGAQPAADQPKQAEGTPAPAEKTPVPPPAAPAPAPAPAPGGVTPGAHSAAPAGMAQCPDAPSKSIMVVGCKPAPASASPADDDVVDVPKRDTAPLGGDPERQKFAEDLSQCHAARVAKETIESRFQKAVGAAKTQATSESKQDTETALKTATEGIDPKDKRAIAKARADAAATAKKAAAKKIADAQAAVRREDLAVVTAELAKTFKKQLTDDYAATIDAKLKEFGPKWVKAQKAARKAKRAQVTKEKNAKPKVRKGQQAPPPMSPPEISAAIEEEMTEFRCEQQREVLQTMEDVTHAWGVGRREQVDFDTREKNPYLKDFAPTYKASAGDLVPVPGDTKGAMPGLAPEMVDFLNAMKAKPATPPFQAENYSPHGLGAWESAGFSVDLKLTDVPRDQRGFWRHNDAVQFLLQMDATAKSLGASWRVLYNDYRVAEEVNAATKTRNVAFTGNIDKGGNLNWHGPEGLKLHFHLDLKIPRKPPAPATPPACAPGP